MTEQLQILISANVAQAQQSLRQVQQNINDTAKESSKLSKIGDALATGMKAAAKVITAATAAAATGIAALTKGAVNNFGEYEQLVGGVDTLKKVLKRFSNMRMKLIKHLVYQLMLIWKQLLHLVPAYYKA